jgi:xanthine dehydrogenase small subunit
MPADTQPIRFYHRGQIACVDDVATTRSVLDWLRIDAHCTGTKEGCNEGDCGACTVVVGQLSGDGLALQPVNACLQFLPTLHGKALFSVEDLRPRASAELHPVQQALVECHGSQCGFCTPGFVMSLWAGYERHQRCGTRPTRQQLADDLAGNLCRCTGYRPILDAGQRMFDLPAVRLDTAPVIAALQQLQAEAGAGLHYTGPSPVDPTRRDRFEAPRTLDALATRYAAQPDTRLLAGATDIGLWVTKQFRDLPALLYVGEVAELKTIEERDGLKGPELSIGAGASLDAAWRALAQRWPELHEHGLRFASPLVRHTGTMGGNLANGSPIGDSAPVLLALDARLELRQGPRVRQLPLSEFYVDYRVNRLEPGEFITRILVPLHASARQLRAYKISKRFDCDISALAAGFALELDGDTVRSVRLAFGGMAGIVKRAPQAEAALTGQPWTQASVVAAQAALAQDFQPLSDLRASAAYRLRVAQNLLQRLWLETRVGDPLPRTATRVFSVMPHAAA